MDSLPQELRTKIYGKLYEAMLGAIEEARITYNEAQLSAGFILQQMDIITTKEQLYQFLQTLATRWDIYAQATKELSNSEVQAKEQVFKQEDQQKIVDLQGKLNKLIN